MEPATAISHPMLLAKGAFVPKLITALNSNPLKLRVLHFTFESALTYALDAAQLDLHAKNHSV
jgi:hypothetical protein